MMDAVSFIRGFFAGVGLTSLIVGLCIGIAIFGRITNPDVRIEREREYARPFRGFDRPGPGIGATGSIGDKPAN